MYKHSQTLVGPWFFFHVVWFLPFKMVHLTNVFIKNTSSKLNNIYTTEPPSHHIKVVLVPLSLWCWSDRWFLLQRECCLWCNGCFYSCTKVHCRLPASVRERWTEHSELTETRGFTDSFFSSFMSVTHGATFYCVHMLRPQSVNNNETIKQSAVPDVHSLWTWPRKSWPCSKTDAIQQKVLQDVLLHWWEMEDHISGVNLNMMRDICFISVCIVCKCRQHSPHIYIGEIWCRIGSGTVRLHRRPDQGLWSDTQTPALGGRCSDRSPYLS